MESIILLLHIGLWFLFVIPLVCLAPQHSAAWVFTDFENLGGWTNNGISWCIGLLSSAFPFVGTIFSALNHKLEVLKSLTGYDGAWHMSEEIENATSIVPRAMYGTPSRYILFQTIRNGQEFWRSLPELSTLMVSDFVSHSSFAVRQSVSGLIQQCLYVRTTLLNAPQYLIRSVLNSSHPLIVLDKVLMIKLMAPIGKLTLIGLRVSFLMVQWASVF